MSTSLLSRLPPQKALIACAWGLLLTGVLWWSLLAPSEDRSLSERSLDTPLHSRIPVLGIRVTPDTTASELQALLDSVDAVVDVLAVMGVWSEERPLDPQAELLLKELQQGKWNQHIRSTIVHQLEADLGASGTVNEIISQTKSMPYWLVAPDLGFAFIPGALQSVAKQMRGSLNHKEACVWGLEGTDVSKYGVFVVTPRALETVGYLDENQWPSYAQGCDYTTRLMRGNCPMIQEHSGLFARCVADRCWSRQLVEAINSEYILEKWGTDICRLQSKEGPTYMRDGGYPEPFNRPSSKLKDWSVDLEARQKRGGPPTCSSFARRQRKCGEPLIVRREPRRRPERGEPGTLSGKWHKFKVDLSWWVFKMFIGRSDLK